jgi:hypothetical protein
VAALALAPVIMAMLSLVVPGSEGFGAPAPDAMMEPNQLLVVMTTAAALMGVAVSYKAVVGEHVILMRELAAGLSTWAYIGAKLIVYAIVCAVQATLFMAIFSAAHPLASHQSLPCLPSGAELWLVILAAAYASCCLSLLFSALVRSTDQVVQILVVNVLAQLVLCGGLFPVIDNILVNSLSWFVPARWGFAAAASSIDLRHLIPTHTQDVLWTGNAPHFIMALGVLLMICVGSTALLKLRLDSRARA